MPRRHRHLISRIAAFALVLATLSAWPLEAAHCAWMAAARAQASGTADRAEACGTTADHSCCPQPERPEPAACFCAADQAPAAVPAAESLAPPTPVAGKLFTQCVLAPSLAHATTPSVWRDVGEARDALPACAPAPSRALRAPPTSL